VTEKSVPQSYKLKRIAARAEKLLWRGERIYGLAAAPIYLFPDQARFDHDDIEKLAIDKLVKELPLPHDAFIFEVVAPQDEIGSQVAYIQRTDEGIEGFFWVLPRNTRNVTDVLAHATFRENMVAEIEINPRAIEQSRRYADCLTAIFWRGLAILSTEPEKIATSVPLSRRPKLKRAGVTGWTWTTVEINTDAISRARSDSGGTHASPRWHVRRGHWRTLVSGKRVFVKECEVGNPEIGGVVKDYFVRPQSAGRVSKP
jgi:hypothetical protein